MDTKAALSGVVFVLILVLLTVCALSSTVLAPLQGIG